MEDGKQMCTPFPGAPSWVPLQRAASFNSTTAILPPMIPSHSLSVCLSLSPWTHQWINPQREWDPISLSAFPDRVLRGSCAAPVQVISTSVSSRAKEPWHAQKSAFHTAPHPTSSDYYIPSVPFSQMFSEPWRGWKIRLLPYLWLDI